jgi:hypothetical protein
MANVGSSFGLSGEISRKMAGKRDTAKEAALLKWVFAVIGETAPNKSFEDTLKDGVVLCKFINKLAPGSVKNVQTSTMPFKQMENIGAFQAGAKAYGCSDVEVFQTADLFDKKNLAQVQLCLAALARLAKEKNFNGPKYDFSEAEGRKLEGN